MPGMSRLDLLYPTVGKWDAPNDLRILALYTTQVDKTDFVALEECVWSARIFDTSNPRVPRLEPILSFTAAVRDGDPLPTFYPPWEGSYVPRGRFGPISGAFRYVPDLVYPHIIIQLHRTKPLISGCPFLLQATYGREPPFTFPFGVGPRAAFDWPRDQENVQFDAQSLPPPLDKLAAHFQAVSRDEHRLTDSSHKIDVSTSGVDAGSEDGHVLGGTVLSEAMVKTDRRDIDITDPATWEDATVGIGS